MTPQNFICPDCGFTQPKAANESFQVCDSCFKNNPDPLRGWPVTIRWVGKKGRGVYLTENTPRDTLVERCHAIQLGLEETVNLANTLPTLARYVFPWPIGRKAFLTGCGLLYNYDSQKVTGKNPSVKAVIRRGMLAVEFCTLRDMVAGEELTFDYRDIRQFRP